jgi:hypothetical protein
MCSQGLPARLPTRRPLHPQLASQSTVPKQRYRISVSPKKGKMEALFRSAADFLLETQILDELSPEIAKSLRNHLKPASGSIDWLISRLSSGADPFELAYPFLHGAEVEMALNRYPLSTLLILVVATFIRLRPSSSSFCSRQYYATKSENTPTY